MNQIIEFIGMCCLLLAGIVLLLGLAAVATWLLRCIYRLRPHEPWPPVEPYFPQADERRWLRDRN